MTNREPDINVSTLIPDYYRHDGAISIKPYKYLYIPRETEYLQWQEKENDRENYLRRIEGDWD